MEPRAPLALLHTVHSTTTSTAPPARSLLAPARPLRPTPSQVASFAVAKPCAPLPINLNKPNQLRTLMCVRESQLVGQFVWASALVHRRTAYRRRWPP